MRSDDPNDPSNSRYVVRWEFMGPLVFVTPAMFVRMTHGTPHRLRVMRIERRAAKRAAFVERERKRQQRKTWERNAAAWDIRACNGLFRQLKEAIRERKD